MLMIAHASEAGLTLYNPSTLSGVAKMLSEVLRQFGFETAEAQASVQLKCDFPETGDAKFWYFKSVNGCEEDARRLLTAATFASSYEQAVTLLYVTYCWEQTLPVAIIRKGGKYVVGTATFTSYAAASKYLRKLNGD